MRSNRILIAVFLCLFLPVCALASNEFEFIDWIDGPALIDLGEVAQLDLPAGYRYAAAESARALLEVWEAPADGDLFGLAMAQPDTGRKMEWYVVLEYREIGHVSDDQAAKLHFYAGNVLKMLQEEHRESRGGFDGDARNRDDIRANVRRYTANRPGGWAEPLEYDQETRRLRWSIAGQNQTLRVRSRHLGRSGVLFADMALTPESRDRKYTTRFDLENHRTIFNAGESDDLQLAKDEYESLMAGLSFLPELRYERYQDGDRAASVGLQGLVIGTHAVSRSWFKRLIDRIDGVPRMVRRVAMYGILGLIGLFGARRHTLRQQLKEDGLR